MQETDSTLRTRQCNTLPGYSLDCFHFNLKLHKEFFVFFFPCDFPHSSVKVIIFVFQCLSNDLMCRNNLCVDKSRFCDGTDDCRDGTDEPLNCSTDCAVALETINSVKK